MANGRTLTVLLGAGASYDCASSPTSVVKDEFRPPLVKELFKNRPGFNNILTKYPKAEALSETIRARLANHENSENLETILRELDSEESIYLKKRLWEVPLYLQELLGEVSEHYVESGGTRFDTLISEIER